MEKYRIRITINSYYLWEERGLPNSRIKIQINMKIKIEINFSEHFSCVCTEMPIDIFILHLYLLFCSSIFFCIIIMRWLGLNGRGKEWAWENGMNDEHILLCQCPWTYMTRWEDKLWKLASIASQRAIYMYSIKWSRVFRIYD